MAWRQLHPLDVRHVPGGDDQAARIGVAADLLEEPGDLIVGAAVRTLPRAPLLAVDGPKVAAGVGPFVPDGDAMLLEIGDVGVAVQEPDKLVHDRLQVQLLGGDQGKALVQVEANLPSKQRADAGAGAVALDRAVIQGVAHEIEIGAHRGDPREPAEPPLLSDSASRSALRTGPLEKSGSPSRTRTCDHSINSRMLYQLSYRGSAGRPYSRFSRPAKPLFREPRPGEDGAGGARAVAKGGELRMVLGARLHILAQFR